MGYVPMWLVHLIQANTGNTKANTKANTGNTKAKA